MLVKPHARYLRILDVYYYKYESVYLFIATANVAAFSNIIFVLFTVEFMLLI